MFTVSSSSMALAVLWLGSVNSFVVEHPVAFCSKYRSPHIIQLQNSFDPDEEFGLSSNEPEKSRMLDYISAFLKQQNGESETDKLETIESSSSSSSTDPFTHLVAIPLDACYELLLELESVQRAILYHCPILVHACITQAMTRLPLLYVKTDSSTHSSTRLNQLVQEVVNKCVFIPATEDQETRGDDIKRVDGTPDFNAPNADGFRPLLIPFQSLEIDGVGNEALLTVANPNSEGARKLQSMVTELRIRIEKEGWTTALPPDPKSNGDEFRPRIPFMRLPQNWNTYLNSSEEFLTSDQGGNGISPIFWCQWWDDKFGEARMPEVAVYTRRDGFHGLNEDAFYVPSRVTALPRGNDALTSKEQRFQEYQEKRMIEEEVKQSGDMEIAQDIADDDPLLKSTRKRLEDLIASSANDSYPDIFTDDDDDTTLSYHNEVDTSNKRSDELVAEDFRPSDPGALDDWTRERIQKVVSSRAREKSLSDLAKPKEKPPIAENEVFKKYKEGTLVPKQEVRDPPKALPPFPSQEHCIGFWRMVSSPTGFPVEEGISDRSDNLILRVDGTTAGGPVFDQETRQKASGGTWRLMGDTTSDATLRIRLVIPPKKERILVMEGRLDLVSMSPSLPMTRNTFGIPELEEKASEVSKTLEDLLYCSGKVWIEDAVTARNRDDIGKFSIMKLNTPTDRSQYTITIPKPIRNQD